jgi:hypothetical protein
VGFARERTTDGREERRRGGIEGRTEVSARDRGEDAVEGADEDEDVGAGVRDDDDDDDDDDDAGTGDDDERGTVFASDGLPVSSV